MARNQPGDLSRDLRCPRIEVPASDRRLVVRPDDRLNFVEHNRGSRGAEYELFWRGRTARRIASIMKGNRAICNRGRSEETRKVRS